jgi:mono/diheme cytochrome c family protein
VSPLKSVSDINNRGVIVNLRRTAVVSLFFFFACSHAQVPLPSLAPSANGDTSAARGEYIVRNVAVCGSCHAADEHNPDGALSGGREFRDWRIGVARASNLTSDVETGLGSWSEAEIVRAFRNGERKDGRLIAPVMPYGWFNEMSDDDALAVARYLKSLPPVSNHVTQNPNIVFKIGKLLFLGPKGGVSRSAPPRAATAEYGGYLSQHAGLCADCHTQRTGIRSEPDRTRLLAGMDHPPAGFPKKPSNLTPDAETGIGRWSERDFIETLRTGKDPAGVTMHPFMPWKQIQRMTDDDMRAVYRFLRSLKPIRNDGAPARSR